MNKFINTRDDQHKANLLYNAGKYEQSIVRAKRIILEDHSNSSIYLRIAKCFYEQKNNDAALQEYQQAALMRPLDTFLLFELVRLYKLQGAYEKAATMYSKIIDIYPHHSGAYIDWGICLRKQGKYAEAISKYSKASEINPEDTVAINNWAIVLYEQLEYDAAISKWTEIIHLSLEDDVYFNLGLAFYQQQKISEAQEKFKRGLNGLERSSLTCLMENFSKEISDNQARLSLLTDDAHIKHCERTIEGLQELIHLVKSQFSNDNQ